MNWNFCFLFYFGLPACSCRHSGEKHGCARGSSCFYSNNFTGFPTSYKCFTLCSTCSDTLNLWAWTWTEDSELAPPSLSCLFILRGQMLPSWIWIEEHSYLYLEQNFYVLHVHTHLNTCRHSKDTQSVNVLVWGKKPQQCYINRTIVGNVALYWQILLRLHPITIFYHSLFSSPSLTKNHLLTGSKQASGGMEMSRGSRGHFGQLIGPFIIKKHFYSVMK